MLWIIAWIEITQVKFHNDLEIPMKYFYSIQNITKNIISYISKSEQEVLKNELINELSTYSQIYKIFYEKDISDLKKNSWKNLQAFQEIQKNTENIALLLFSNSTIAKNSNDQKIIQTESIKTKIFIKDCKNFFHDQYFTTPNHQHLCSFWILFDILDLEDLTINWIKTNYLSSWEKSIFYRICEIAGEISDELSMKILLLLIDEPDTFLHIKRQKQYIKLLLDFINLLNRPTQIILATHSPFIISDIPENNLLILENGSDVTKHIRNNNPNSFANTTFDIVSEYMWATTGKWETIWDFTKKIIDEYVSQMKGLLIKKWTREKKYAHSNNNLINSEIDDKIQTLQVKYRDIIKWIGDPILREYLLLLR